MTSKVSLSLAVVLGLTDPPEWVESVDDYKRYISDLLVGGYEGTRAKPGRPLKAAHPHYTDLSLKAIKAYILEEAKAHPDDYTRDGRPIKGFADKQPDDAATFHMDNGVVVSFAGPVDIVEGIASPMFPPSVYSN